MQRAHCQCSRMRGGGCKAGINFRESTRGDTLWDVWCMRHGESPGRSTVERPERHVGERGVPTLRQMPYPSSKSKSDEPTIHRDSAGIDGPVRV